MIKFDGLVIMVLPDYKDRAKNGIKTEEFTCSVYDESDTAFKNSLFSFSLISGKDFEYETVEDVEIAVRRTVDLNWATIQFQKANKKLERTKELFKNAVIYIKEVTDPENYEKVFKDVLGMIDEEIQDSIEELSEKQTQNMNLS